MTPEERDDLICGPELATVQKLALGPDDMIVLTYPGCMSSQHRKRIFDVATSYWPNHKVIVLDGGLQMHIVSTEEADEPTILHDVVRTKEIR